MEKYNKIHWTKGLDITPEIFIGSDNYHIAERNLLGHCLAFRSYGILPDRKFHIRKRIDTRTNTLFIDNLECLAITGGGYVINIQEDAPFSKEVSLNETIGTEDYVFLTVNPFSITPVDDKNLYIYPEYKFVFKRFGETVGNGIPILKICYDNGNQCWKVDESYIPPSIVLDSVEILKQQYLEIKNKLNHITEKLPDSDKVYIQVMLLKMELENDYLQKTPQELILLLKKICWILKFYIKTEKKTAGLPVVEKFLEEQYNHNDIWKILDLGIQSLVEINQKIDEKPVEEELDEMIIRV